MPEPYRPPTGLRPHWRRPVAWLGVLATIALVTALRVADGCRLPGGVSSLTRPVRGIDREVLEAERLMSRAEDIVRSAKARAGLQADPLAGNDPSGLIGDELTPLVTTLGALEAKRTATNPRWAGELARRMAEVGVGHGDLVAAGFSGSFPGLNLAVMCATKSLGADLIAVSSITASTWGANQPGFTWPEIENRLVRSGLLTRASIAVTAGGDADRGPTFDPDGAAQAERILASVTCDLGVSALRPATFAAAVQDRMALYRRASNGRRVVLYVNVGGTSASLGRSAAVLKLRSGFIPPQLFDRSNERGVTARFAEDGVRVLMLLNVRDLALRWGLPLEGRSE
jgi:poly-gamma-glutamate system protein